MIVVLFLVDPQTTQNDLRYVEQKLKISTLDIKNNLLSNNSNESLTELTFEVCIPEIFHCTLKSGRKQLKVELVVNDNSSATYNIGKENGAQNSVIIEVDRPKVE
jgi:hypothetical protein